MAITLKIGSLDIPIGTQATSSWSINSVSSSYSNTASYALNSGAATLNTGSTYPITASWAISASYAPGGTPTVTGTNFNVPTILSNTLVSSSLWANATQVSVGSSSFDPSSPEPLMVWGTGSVSINAVAGFYHDTNNFSQIKNKNFNSGNTASVDLVCESDSGSNTYGYIDLGINNSGYTEPLFNLSTKLDGYVYTVGSGSTGGNLTIGTLSANKAIIFHTSGSTTSNERIRITDNGITSSVAITGSFVGKLTGTASYAISTSLVPSAGRAVGLCAAYTPLIIGPDAAEVPIPYSSIDGVTQVSWSVKRINIRAQTAESVSSSIAIEKSIVAGAFAATEIGRILLPTSSYEAFTGSLSTVNSGDKMRFNVIQLGTSTNWTLLVEISPI